MTVACPYGKGVIVTHSIALSMKDAGEGIEIRRSSAPEKYAQNENAVTLSQWDRVRVSGVKLPIAVPV